MTLPRRVTLVECGPAARASSSKGIGHPDKISTADKIRLVEALAETGMRDDPVRLVSSRRARFPQMADSEAVCAGITKRAGVDYTGIYLNDVGLKRAITTGKADDHRDASIIHRLGKPSRYATRSAILAEDLAMQRKDGGPLP